MAIWWMRVMPMNPSAVARFGSRWLVVFEAPKGDAAFQFEYFH